LVPCGEIKVQSSRFKGQSFRLKAGDYGHGKAFFAALNADVSACVLSGQWKNCEFAMQAQDTTTLFLLKLWPWVEANRNRLIAGGVIAVIAIFWVSFMVWQRGQKEKAAGQALTQVALSGGAQLADAYLKIAAQYPGTIAGQRALLQGAAALFDAGKFTDAQARFQKFLDAHPDSEFSDQARLGVATCLDAQGKTDLAVGAYQRVISNASDPAVVSAAKYGLARIEESQGRLNDAFVLYQDVANAAPGSSLGSEATMRLIELRSKLPAAAPAATPAAASNPGR
jgi:predicted negative regulator of RcsB-dependent stress response